MPLTIFLLNHSIWFDKQVISNNDEKSALKKRKKQVIFKQKTSPTSIFI